MVKKVFILFNLLFFFISCKKETVKYYPSKKVFDISLSKEINLDNTILNFNKIVDSVAYYSDKTQKTAISFKDNTTTKKIIFYHFGNGLMKEKNILHIKNDSIFISDLKYSIKNIYVVLKNHYTNNGKDPSLSSSYKQAIVEIFLSNKKESSQNLKELLLTVTNTFDKINKEVKDSLLLFLFVNKYKRMKTSIPPPPTEIKN